MTRISATAAILICLVFFHPLAATAQSDQEQQCFPWQEYRDGRCVGKPSQAPPPLPAPAPAPAAANPCAEGMRNLSGQCNCPINTHLDAGGHCVADVAPVPPALPPPAVVSPVPARKADDTVVCDGGTVTGGRCVCPAGYNVMPASDGAGGGTCVRMNAENCLGGELTVSGTCLCNGQVVMSGETYLLEYARGKCVPKRCPVQTELKDGKCVAISAVSPGTEPEAKPKPASKEPAKEATKETPKEMTEEGERRPHCGRGMVRTRNGCVAARKLPGIYAAPPPALGAPQSSLSKYYRSYQFPGNQ